MSQRIEIMLLVLFLVMVALTVVCGLKIEQYETVGPDLLTGQWRFYAGDAGVAEKRGAELYLSSPDGESVSIRQDLDSLPPGQVVRLSGDMRCKGVKAGERLWNHARLLLVQWDGDMERMERPHVAVSLTGTVGWKHYGKYFTIGPDTASLSVIVQLSRCSGDFWVRNLRLHPMTQTAVYTRVKRAVLAGWGLFAVCLLGSVLYRSPRKILPRVLLTGIFAAILVGAVIPADLKSLWSDGLEAWVSTAGNVVAMMVSGNIARIGHFVFFFVFGAVLTLVLRHRGGMPAIEYLLMVAGGSEVIQTFIDGRSPFVMDFMTDVVGGVAGIALVILWRRMAGVGLGRGLRPRV